MESPPLFAVIGDWREFCPSMLNLRPIYKILLIVIALMSGIFSLLREVLQTTDPAKYHEKPLFIACLTAACILAFALLWWEERRERIKAEKVLNDDKPKLGINAHSVEGPKAWAENPVPVTFTIQHISGRVPTSIRFDPALSKQGRFSMVFSPLPYANRPPHPTAMSFEVIEVGVPELSAKDWEKTKHTQRQLFDLFLYDCPKGLNTLEYPLISHFMDGDKLCSQAFCLRFEMDRIRFSPDTTQCAS